MAGQVLHPRAVRLRVEPGDGHAAGLELDHEEDEVPRETRQREHLNRDQIAGGQAVPMRLSERLPRRSSGPLGSRFDPVVVQHPLDRVPGDVVAEIRERATDARVPPRWMLDRHPHHEVGHRAWRYRPASTSVGAAVVLPGNQPPVPAEHRVRRDDAGDLRQNPPAEFPASPRESTALGVGQAKWTWATLLSEDPILLPEIIDHVFLVAVHPASGREKEEAQSVGHSLRLLGKQPLAPTLFRRFANLGRFVAPYAVGRSASQTVITARPASAGAGHRTAE